jgi:tryptophanyl-tRNA synthetase
MSKSYENAIFLDDAPDVVAEKLRRYITDPEKIRLKDPGRPEICSVFEMHGLFAEPDAVATIEAECRAGDRGCVACKSELADSVNRALDPIRERKARLSEDDVLGILADGIDRVRPVTAKTIERVRRGVRL